MNKQNETGIEWTDFTWNPVAGCFHRCRWAMPDGAIAKCYAETVAQGIARSAYPRGFEFAYWHPARLEEPLKIKAPSKIFVDSMSDLMGHWVAEEHINAVIQVMRRADWHQFQVLTKAPKRLLKFDWPKNVWVGVSMTPDYMMGQQLTDDQRARFMGVTNDVLAQLRYRGNTTFMSFEPLSWDVSGGAGVSALSWAIIGAASNGRTYYQPNPAHLAALLAKLDAVSVPVFYKGNLRPSIADGQWREEFPPFDVPTVASDGDQLSMF